MTPISEHRFTALVRRPLPSLHAHLYREVEWYACDGERLLGTIVLDRVDNDHSWVVMCQDATGAYRATECDTSLPTREKARQALEKAMARALTRSINELRAAQNRTPDGITKEQAVRLVEVMAEYDALLRKENP